MSREDFHTLRLFTAVWPDAAARNELAGWVRRWGFPPDARPVPSDDLHITLNFIGAVSREALPQLIEALDIAFPPFELRLGRPALWPPDTAVLELAHAPDVLLELQSRLAQRLRGIGLPEESRRYRPHLTLARRAGRKPPPAAGPYPRWHVRELTLVQSRVGMPNRYQVLERFTARRRPDPSDPASMP